MSVGKVKSLKKRSRNTSGEMFHEFKSQIYMEMLNKFFQTLAEPGLEYGGPRLQTPLAPGM
jgi:hypothetical protein